MFKIRRITLLFALISLTMVACDKGGNDGVEYLESGDGKAFNEGDYVIFNLKVLTDNDSVLIDTEESGEIPVPIADSLLTQRGELTNLLASLSMGDSVFATVGAYDLFNNDFGQPVPASIDSASRIKVYAKPTAVYDSAGIQKWAMERRQKQMAEMQKQMSEQKTEDDDILQAFFEENNIMPEKTESGLYYVIEEAGTGVKAEAGDTVRVNYTGTLLDGSFFDSSYEEVAKKNDRFNPQRNYGPLEFQLGKNQVIRGWDEGLSLLKEGAEATFYIPSYLAYGPRARGEDIPANSILVFEVDLVEVKKSSK